MKEIINKSITEFHELHNLPKPENPLFSIIHTKLTEDERRSCDDEGNVEPIRYTNQFYSMSFKHIIAGEILYGRTRYDCTNGTMLFTAPNQTMTLKGIAFCDEAYHIALHKDYIRGHDLYHKIKKYHFFDYHVNEALHLSPKEEAIIRSVFRTIEAEYQNNQDEFSKEIILSQVETLLKYADRFYKRQFLNRREVTGELVTRFERLLSEYFESGAFEEQGIPGIEEIANELHMSPRYLSDSLKAETGKTAIEHIHLYLIDEAKNLLLEPKTSVSEIAYRLGFEYPNYFSRLFKKKVGLTPSEYRGHYVH